VRQGTRLQVAYFDQMRAALNLDATLVDTISPGSEWIEIGQEPKVTRKHVMSYLSDFLFSPERANSPVRTLSGGERNRVLLARLFALSANVLVLDEPTNDLDIDTLDLLEDLLQAYGGTVFLVSARPAFPGQRGDQHHRLGGRPRLRRPARPVARIRRRLRGLEAAARTHAPSGTAGQPQPRRRWQPSRPSRQPCKAVRSKLSYKEQRELDALPGRIEALEAEQKALAEQLASADLYVKEPQRVPALQARHEAIETELLGALERWEVLSSR
jgi:ATP-binding cassette subfamily F protein uup